MKTHRIIAALAVAGVTLGVVACGATDQDTGDNNDIASGLKLSGTIVDGYVARAVVFVDKNENGELDALESDWWAMTDNEGRLGTSADGSTNYCAEDATEEQARHCLKADLRKGETVTLRTSGGYDIVTGERFYGSMSQRVTIGADGTVDDFANTPLTSFLQAAVAMQKWSGFSVDDATLESELVAAVDVDNSLGITADDLKSDFFKDADTDLTDVQKRLIGAALQLHKSVDAIASNIEANMGSGDAPSDVSRYVYEAMAFKWAENGAYPTISDLVTGTTYLDGVISEAVDRINADPDYDLSLATTSLDTNLASAAAQVAGAVEIDEADDLGEVKQRARAVEVVTRKARKNPSDSSLDDAASLASEPEYLATLTDEADLEYVDTAVTDGSSSDAAGVAAGLDFTGRPRFFGDSGDANLLLEGGTIAETVLKLDADDNSSDKFHLYFGEDTVDGTGAGGELVACVWYDDSDSGYDTDDSWQLVSGRWSKLSPFGFLINLTVAGTEEARMVKTLPLDSNGHVVWAYDYGEDEFKKSRSGKTPTALREDDDSPFQPYTDAFPTTSTDCET